MICNISTCLMLLDSREEKGVVVCVENSSHWWGILGSKLWKKWDTDMAFIVTFIILECQSDDIYRNIFECLKDAVNRILTVKILFTE